MFNLCSIVLTFPLPGPPANSSEAASWRQFWGERSELRRFQSGEVLEVVSWPADRERVLTEVVTSVIARHHKLCVLQRDGGDWAAALLQGDGGAGARALLDRLSPLLYSLELSLKVAGVTALGPGGRGTRLSPHLLQEPGGKTVREEGGVAKISSKTGMAPRFVLIFQSSSFTIKSPGTWSLSTFSSCRSRAGSGRRTRLL